MDHLFRSGIHNFNESATMREPLTSASRPSTMTVVPSWKMPGAAKRTDVGRGVTARSGLDFFYWSMRLLLLVLVLLPRAHTYVLYDVTN